jgi:SAM-dependent methyltransferase
VLTRAQARAFYDRLGARQDSQAFYEDRAVAELVLRADFEQARAVFELGCGTGRLAERLLAEWLPESSFYVGVDVSPVMERLARERVARFGERAEVRLISGSPSVEAAGGSFDRFLSTYVLDLLPEDEIRAWLAEAHRLLRPGGRLLLVGLTRGTTPLSRLVAGAWSGVHALSARLVGGCRPLELIPLLAEAQWESAQRKLVVAWGIPSEVVVARRRA